MTTLFLMRHARAVKAAPGMRDFDRPLAASGRADAQEMGKVLKARFELPAMVVCSGARRTRETLDALGLELPEQSVRFSDELFNADGSGYVAALKGETAASILLIGHNPSIHDAAMALAGDGDGIARGALASAFPTSAVAVLDCSEPLGELAAGQCYLREFLTPTGGGAA